MEFVRVLPVVISLLLLAAHFFRAGYVVLAGVFLAMPILLAIKARWVARLLQIVLVIGALEWIRTLVIFATARAAAGQSWTRLAVILGVVALLTLLSAMVFQGASLSRRYRLHPNRL